MPLSDTTARTVTLLLERVLEGKAGCFLRGSFWRKVKKYPYNSVGKSRNDQKYL